SKWRGRSAAIVVDFMSYRSKLILTVLLLLLLSVFKTLACSLNPMYFYEVTALKGRVVGMHTRHEFAPRWLRHMFLRKHAKLALYEYGQPLDKTLPLKTVETDGNARFDFGPLKAGHYTLTIDDEDFFNVEIKDLPRKTESVTIDVSPINPDCKGGHEFVIKME